jgi:spore maturation protein CgeB
MDGISSRFLREMKPFIRLLVGQIAAPLPKSEDFSGYDLVVSALPSYVDHFRSMGVAAEVQQWAFEPRVLSSVKEGPQNIPVSFVGSVTLHHRARVQLLESLCTRQQVKIWGGAKGLPDDSPIRLSYMGQAWGRKMYEVLRRSKITLNHHIGIAGPYAANMRLFEATGVGTMLLTDWKSNLKDMFEPGKEVVAYRTNEECMELLSYYLDHDEERDSIARAGHQRTLRDHNYYQRMGEFVEIVRKYN